MKKRGGAVTVAVAVAVLAFWCAAAGAATLRVTSFPEGAQVLIDGVNTGEVTPTRLTLPDNSTVTVRVQVPDPRWVGQESTMQLTSLRNRFHATLLPTPTSPVPSAVIGGTLLPSVPIEFETFSISQSLARDAVGVGTRASSAEFSQFKIIKAIDAATPVLRRLSETGAILPEVRISLIIPGLDPLMITLSNAIVVGDVISSAPVQPPREEISLIAESYTWSGAGGGSVSYSLATGTPSGSASLPAEYGLPVMPPANGVSLPGVTAVSGFDSGITSTIDPATGTRTGEVVHDPVKITKAVDALTTGALAMMLSGTFKSSVKVGFWRYPSATAAPVKYSECTLTDILLTGWSLGLDEYGRLLETIAISYGGITHSVP